MCIAIPSQIVAADDLGLFAEVDTLGTRRRVNVALLEGVTAGDWVLVHAGSAIRTVTEGEAQQTLALLDEIAPGTLAH